jgi:hypothetical protein
MHWLLTDSACFAGHAAIGRYPLQPFAECLSAEIHEQTQRQIETPQVSEPLA